MRIQEFWDFDMIMDKWYDLFKFLMVCYQCHHRNHYTLSHDFMWPKWWCHLISYVTKTMTSCDLSVWNHRWHFLSFWFLIFCFSFTRIFFMEGIKETLDSRDYKKILKNIFSTNQITYIFILFNFCMSWNKIFITIIIFLFIILVAAMFCT